MYYIRIFVILFVIQVVKSMSCVERDTPCPSIDELQATCKHGVTPDMCNQCNECAKDFGESCAGVWNKEGTCGDGLLCTETPNQVDQKIGVCVLDRKSEDEDKEEAIPIYYYN